MAETITMLEFDDKLVLTKNITNLTIKQLLQTNNKYVTISTIINFNNDTINLGKNTTIVFTNKGKFSNCTLVGNNSKIISNQLCFDNVIIQGTWTCSGNVEWYTKGSDLSSSNYTDCTAQLQSALNSSFKELIFPPMLYYITQSLIISKSQKIIMQGSRLNQPLNLILTNGYTNFKNTSIIFTNKNISLLKIDVDNSNTNQWEKHYIEICGGNFDVSLNGSSYSSNCIEVLADNNNNHKQKLWGLNLNTSIIGYFAANSDGSCEYSHGVGIYLNPTMTYNESLKDTNLAYMTQIRINSDIQYFGLAVKAYNNEKRIPGVSTNYYNWCTDIIVDGYIAFCRKAIESNTNINIRAHIQAVKCLRYYSLYSNAVSANKGDDYYKRGKNALIEITEGALCNISSDIIDVTSEWGLPTTDGMVCAPYYVLYVDGLSKVSYSTTGEKVTVNHCPVITASEQFYNFLKGCRSCIHPTTGSQYKPIICNVKIYKNGALVNFNYLYENDNFINTDLTYYDSYFINSSYDDNIGAIG